MKAAVLTLLSAEAPAGLAVGRWDLRSEESEKSLWAATGEDGGFYTSSLLLWRQCKHRDRSGNWTNIETTRQCGPEGQLGTLWQTGHTGCGFSRLLPLQVGWGRIQGPLKGLQGALRRVSEVGDWLRLRKFQELFVWFVFADLLASNCPLKD